MSSIGERLREIRNQRGLNQGEFGSLAGVTKRTQMLYESDQRLPKADYLALLDAEGVDVGYVLTGRRDAAPGESDHQLSEVGGVYRVEDDAVAVKMYDVEGAAGHGRSLDEERVAGVLQFPASQLSALGLSPDHLAGVKVRGDSMEETLADGAFGKELNKPRFWPYFISYFASV